MPIRWWSCISLLLLAVDSFAAAQNMAFPENSSFLSVRTSIRPPQLTTGMREAAELNTTVITPSSELVNATLEQITKANTSTSPDFRNGTAASGRRVIIDSSTAPPPVSRDVKPPRWDKTWDEPFIYDYGTLRKWGLVLGAVLFVMGIMVVTCGRARRLPRCRMSKGKSYQVASA
ncbi:FXYD domain containing ion transport regulator 5 isoform X2 [Denticeps clupeoides]|nr:FXYD domain-containing ion transport regulator 5-like isoform X2 [Denticeps clupeoides]